MEDVFAVLMVQFVTQQKVLRARMESVNAEPIQSVLRQKRLKIYHHAHLLHAIMTLRLRLVRCKGLLMKFVNW